MESCSRSHCCRYGYKTSPSTWPVSTGTGTVDIAAQSVMEIDEHNVGLSYGLEAGS